MLAIKLRLVIQLRLAIYVWLVIQLSVIIFHIILNICTQVYCLSQSYYGSVMDILVRLSHLVLHYGIYCLLFSVVEKVWKPGNLVARKFLKNQALAERFWIFLLHFLTSKQFCKSIKRNDTSISRKCSYFLSICS